MTLKILPATEEEFRSLSADWNRLLAASAADNLFLTWEWIHTWWEHFNSGNKLSILLAWNDQELVGIAPFYLQTAKIPGGPKVLKFCSSADLYPDYMDFIAEKMQEAAVLESFARYLLEHGKDWDVIQFDHVLENSLAMKFKEYFERQYAVTRIRTSLCPYVTIDDSFEDYIKDRLCANKRYNIPRKAKVLFDEKKARFETVADAQSVPGAVKEYFELHLKRSRAKGMKSSLDSETVRRFHMDYAQKAAHGHLLRMYFIRAAGKPVGAAYGFHYRDKLYYYHITFDPDWGKWSPGTVLLKLWLEEARKEGAREFDFLKGDESYKSDWKTGERAEYRLQIFNRTAAGRAAYGWALVKKFLKNRFRSGKEREHVSAL